MNEEGWERRKEGRNKRQKEERKVGRQGGRKDVVKRK